MKLKGLNELRNQRKYTIEVVSKNITNYAKAIKVKIEEMQNDEESKEAIEYMEKLCQFQLDLWKLLNETIKTELELRKYDPATYSTREESIE